MSRIGALRVGIVAAALAAVAWVGPSRAQQKIDPMDLSRVQGMLRDAYDCVKKHYYDPRFHGIDWEARYLQYQEKLKAAKSLNAGMITVAAFLDALKDSHTYFLPPSRPYRVEYGYRLQLFGDDAFITRVRPGTDAEAKIASGDQVITLNGYNVNREDFRALQYSLNSLSPQQATKLVLRNPVGHEREVVITTKIKQGRKMMNLTGSDDGSDIWDLIREEENEDHMVRQRYAELGDVMIWKMPEFFLEDAEVDRLFGMARKHKSLILDLRGNPGGTVSTLERMVENVIDHDLNIANRVGRKPMKPQHAKTRGDHGFTGQLIVLVDSASASASELFARVVQLEHRGTVLGDRSSGSVMESRGYPCAQGADIKIFYAFSVTDADLIMSDGKSLEHTGVVPDQIILPTAQDLATGRDPVLARAAQLAGLNLEPAAAGKLFPFEWRPL